MRRNRLYCKECGQRKSTVIYSKKDGVPIAFCDVSKGGCGALIPLYRDEYGKWHPVRYVRDGDAPRAIVMRCTVCGANCYDDGTKDCDCDAVDYFNASRDR